MTAPLTPAAGRAHQPGRLPGDRRLTAQRLKCLVLAANGCTNAEIAQRLWISEETVKSHFRLIYEDLGARDRANAVAIALVRGLIHPHQVHLNPPRSPHVTGD